MNDLITTALSILLLTYPIVILLYVRSLNQLVQLEKATHNTIFGHLYINLSQMISDLTFAKDLWSGKRIKHTENQALKKSLIKARSRLKLTAYFGVILLLVFILNEVLNTA